MYLICCNCILIFSNFYIDYISTLAQKKIRDLAKKKLQVLAACQRRPVVYKLKGILILLKAMKEGPFLFIFFIF